MFKLSENQQAALDALVQRTNQMGVSHLSKSAWRQACDSGVSVNTAAMLKTGSVVSLKVIVSTNGKVTELYAPAPQPADA